MALFIHRCKRAAPLPLALVAMVAVFAAGCSRPNPCGDCVVLIGDSITANWLGLQTGSELAGLKVVNRGIPSEVTAQMRSRFDRDVVRTGPRVVVILGGINDFARVPLASTERNLEAMAERAAHNNIEVVLATLPPTGFSPRQQDPSAPKGYGHDKIQELNDWITTLAARKHYSVVDYHSVLADGRGFYLDGLTADGIHPSTPGYERMEQVLSAAIEAAR